MIKQRWTAYRVFEMQYLCKDAACHTGYGRGGGCRGRKAGYR